MSLTELKIISLSNKWHYFAILVVLVALSFLSQLVIILLFIYLYFLYKFTDIFLIGLIITILVFFILLTNHQKTSIISENQEVFEVTIIDYTKKTYNYEILVKYKKERILVTYNSPFEFKSGDFVRIEGKLRSPEKGSFQGDFDYANYLKKKNIFYILHASFITKIRSTFHINKVKNNLLDHYFNKLSEETYAYISSLVFANKVFQPSLNNDITSIGLSYLFAISGMHIILIYEFMKKVLKKIFFDEQLVTKITLAGLFLYTLLLQSSSVNRAFLMLLIAYFNKRYKWHQTKLDILSITLIVLFLYRPLSIYETAFILSFLVTFFLILVGSLTRDTNIIRQTYKITLLSFFVSLPIVINMNNEINLITLFISPLLAVIYSIVVLPVTYISLIMPIDLFRPIFSIYNTLIATMGSIDMFKINYRYININFILVYYFLLFILLKDLFNKKKIFYKVFGLLFVFILFNNLNIVKPYTKVTFIDVGQGDSTYIELAYNKGNIMIDSFGKNVSYLKTLGVNNLDYLILTHNDLDHTKTTNDLLNTVKVKNVVINEYDDIFDYQLNKNFNLIKVKADDILRIGEIDFYVINPVVNSNKDNNLSIGLYFFITLNFLLTGDMEKEAEKEAVNKYGDFLKADVYKVGHHGSNTSSTKEFVDIVSPKYSIVSAGLNNRYNFPHNKVLENLKDSKIYITYQLGNIDFYLYKNKYKIKTYR